MSDFDAVNEMMVCDLIGSSTGMARNREWLFNHGFGHRDIEHANPNEFVRNFSIDDGRFTFRVHVILDFENSTCSSRISTVSGSIFYELGKRRDCSMIDIFGCSSAEELMHYQERWKLFMTSEEAVRDAVVEGVKTYERCKEKLARHNQFW